MQGDATSNATLFDFMLEDLYKVNSWSDGYSEL